MKPISKIVILIIAIIIIGIGFICADMPKQLYMGDPCGVQVYTYPPMPMELEVVEQINQKYNETFELVATDYMWGVNIDPTMKLSQEKYDKIESSINGLEEHNLYLMSESLGEEFEVKMTKNDLGEWIITDNYLDIKYEEEMIPFFRQGFEECLGYPVYENIDPDFAKQIEVIGIESDKNISLEEYLANSDKCFEFRITTLCENGLSDEEKSKIKEKFKEYFYDKGIDFTVYIWVVTDEEDFGHWNNIPVEKREDTDIIYVTSLPSKNSYSFHGRVY